MDTILSLLNSMLPFGYFIYLFIIGYSFLISRRFVLGSCLHIFLSLITGIFISSATMLLLFVLRIPQPLYLNMSILVSSSIFFLIKDKCKVLKMDLIYLLIYMLVFLIIAFLWSKYGFVTITDDSLAFLQWTRALYNDQYFHPELVQVLCSWGVLIQFIYLPFYIVGFKFVALVPSLIGIHFVIILCLFIRDMYRNKKARYYWELILIMAFMFSGYFELMQFTYLHNNFLSSIALTLAVMFYLWAVEKKSTESLSLCVLFLIFFSLMRLEAFFQLLLISFFLNGFALRNDIFKADDLLRKFMPVYVVVLSWMAYLGFHSNNGLGLIKPWQLLSVSLGFIFLVAGLYFSQVRMIYRQYLAIFVTGVMALFIAILFINPEHFWSSTLAVFTNMFTVNYWGNLWYVIGILLLLFLFDKDEINHFLIQLVIALFISIVFLGFFRTPYRIGWGDSANRMMVHLLPMSVFIVARFLIKSRPI